MTEELKAQILAAETLVVVEDLYRPYRPKRRTRAIIAREKGLDGLANIILLQMTEKSLLEEAESYISEEKGVATAEEAIAGAKDIIAEGISDEAEYRMRIRKMTFDTGKILSVAKDPESKTVYEMYYNFEEPVKKIAGHRVLALNRGEDEKVLTVKVEAPVEDILRYLEKQTITKENPNTTPALQEAIADSYNRLIGPSIEREIRNELTEKEKMALSMSLGKT